jgi:hypothetical protein
VRPCASSQGSRFAVQCTNTGTLAVDTAFVLVHLPDSLSFVSSGLPLTSQDGQTLRFDLPFLYAGQIFSFLVYVEAACGLQLGETVCVEAEIFPQTLCTPMNPGWNGASIAVEGQCEDDSVRFIIRNVGSGNLLTPLEFIVIEDQIMYNQGLFQLDAGEDTTIVSPTNGSNHVLLADQAPNHPGQDFPVAAVEGCDGAVQTGVVNQFPQNEADPFVAIHCVEVTLAYDPNDKQGFPTGVGSDHLIPRGQALDYLIRFQNTGNDTAFNVVLRDTLFAFLDPMTLRPGAASHPYTAALSTASDGRAVLQFTFPNILLPDSTTNLAASQGFVQFRLAQQPDLPDGSQILNRAGIYFDFNAPVMTNTTLHTIGENTWIELIAPTDDLPGKAAEVRVRIAPNPMTEIAYVFVPGWEHEFLKLSLFDAAGRLVREVEGTGQVGVERGALPAGVYFFRLEGRSMVSGKLVIR